MFAPGSRAKTRSGAIVDILHVLPVADNNGQAIVGLIHWSGASPELETWQPNGSYLGDRQSSLDLVRAA